MVYWLGIAIVAGLAACSVNEIAPDTGLEPPPGEGTVVMALTRSGDVNSSIWLLMHKPGGRLPVQVLLDDWYRPRDWKQLTAPSRFNEMSYAALDKPIGRLAVLRLPAGEYEIYQWKGDTLAWPRAGTMYTVQSDTFSVRFTVRPDAVTYLGALQLVLPETIYRGQLHGDFQIRFGDSSERDLTLLKTKYPAASATQVAMAQLPAPSATSGIFYVYPVDNGSMDSHD
jgi:hypothetical protein